MTIEVRPGARPEDLVPGDPAEVERLAARLSRFAIAAGEASARVTGLDAEHWSGQAADLFRAAVGPVPRQLTRAEAAFAAADHALRGYADALRAAQTAAGVAIRMVEQSTPDRAAFDRETAQRMIERAQGEVAEAARMAAARFAAATVDAPAGSGVQGSGQLAAVRTDDGTTVRAVSEHRLADPDGYVASTGNLADSVQYGQEHSVPFAGDSGTPADWQHWAGEGAGRGLGQIEPELLAGLGIAAVGLTAIGRRRRDRTALAAAGLDEAELRDRRQRFGRHRRQDGAAAPTTAGRLPGRSAAWRTHLASPPGGGGTVHPWAGSEANPLPRVRDADAVGLTPADRQVSGVVVHIGPPQDERPGNGVR